MNIYAEITKVDEDQRTVYGYASTEALDSQGEQVTKAAIKDALPDYLKFSNIREMHQPSAVGVAKSADMDDKGLYISAEIVDDKAWEKVKKSVYKGFSIGGKSISKIDGIIQKMRLTEISLVDRPSNPEAMIELFKMDGLDASEQDSELFEIEKHEFSQEERDKLAQSGDAMKDGSFPIKTKQDLENAIKAYGRSKDKAAVMSHIKKRAKALGAEDLIPDTWKSDLPDPPDEPDVDDPEFFDLKKYAGEEAYDAQNAIYALTAIYQLFNKESKEGDAGQMAQLQAVIDNLKAFIASEIMEPPNTTDTDIMYSEQNNDIEKAGARNSAADKSKLQQIHDHATSLGADCGGAAKAAATADIAKLDEAGAEDDAGETIQKLETERDILKARIAELEAIPQTPKIMLKAVEKADDVQKVESTLDQELERIEKMADGPEKARAMIKLTMQHGGIRA